MRRPAGRDSGGKLTIHAGSTRHLPPRGIDWQWTWALGGLHWRHKPAVGGAFMKFGIFYELQLPRPWQPGGELKLDLVARVLVELKFAAGLPWARQLQLVEDAELHLSSFAAAGG